MNIWQVIIAATGCTLISFCVGVSIVSFVVVLNDEGQRPKEPFTEKNRHLIIGSLALLFIAAVLALLISLMIRWAA